MSTTEVRTNTTSATTSGTADLKLEAVVIPVADVDRSKAFYASLGWRLDADFAFDNGFRVVQFTPPGSPASVQFGTNITTAAPWLGPGPVPGRLRHPGRARRARRRAASRSARCSTRRRRAPSSSPTRSGRVGGPADERASYGSFATFSDPDGNSWLLQEITTRLPGRIDSAETSYASVNDLAAGVDPCGDCPRRAREAHRRQLDEEVAGLVRRLHGRRAGRRRAAGLSGP